MKHKMKSSGLKKDRPEETVSAKSLGELAVDIGHLFLNVPYQADTLETPGREKLIVKLSGFDCTTFVETMMALAGCAAAGKMNRTQLQKRLKILRYRSGRIAGYSSRLHYFTDWLIDNEKKQILKDVSHILGGKPLRKKIDFMTTHRDLYAALQNDAVLDKMRQVERTLSRKTFYVIDREAIGKIGKRIEQGDIIAFATNSEGLDVAHIGFAVRQKKSLRLLHASSKEGAVVISKKTMGAYLKVK